jgi:uncharacterized protein (TIGR03083 family)
MDNPVTALGASVDRLRGLCRDLDDSQLEARSYCRDWTIADVLSHLGSGAVIMRRSLEDTLAGRDTPDDFAPAVWDEWNAKTARAKGDDALATDAGLLQVIEVVGEAERARASFPIGPLSVDFDGFVALRVNEHAFHTWDIEVVFDDDARLPDSATGVVVDNLELITRFTGRPTGDDRTIAIHTTDPERRLALRLTPDAVVLSAGGGGPEPDVELPAEAFCRLVYGRLDPGHTPAFTGDAALLNELRAVFPGP